jgi:hypothetical protein
MRQLAFVAAMTALVSLGCDPAKDGFKIPGKKDLAPGGVYVAYNLGCELGCDQIQKGDLIQKLNGSAVSDAKDLAALTDGNEHTVELLSSATKEAKTVKVRATPKNNMPPLKDIPPFWLVSAERLNTAPDWARRRMFGHASPSVMLVSVNGGILDGRELYGKKRLMVYWDWGDREEQAAAVDFQQVLQKARADLEARNVEIMFVHVRFPTGRQAPMNDTDLRAWAKKNSTEIGGQKAPELPMYRFPNDTEFNAARELGMENAFTVFENLGQSPTIVMLDESGIVRWHSEGIMDPLTIGSDVKDPEQATVIRAVDFALKEL